MECYSLAPEDYDKEFPPEDYDKEFPPLTPFRNLVSRTSYQWKIPWLCKLEAELQHIVRSSIDLKAAFAQIQTKEAEKKLLEAQLTTIQKASAKAPSDTPSTFLPLAPPSLQRQPSTLFPETMNLPYLPNIQPQPLLSTTLF
ncbi:hypothetical protein ACLOJK_019390 [Asimina triloba]